MVTLDLRDALRERGHDARLLATTAYLGDARSTADYTCFGTTSGLRTANRVCNAAAHRRLRRVLAEFQPDVVHVRMFMTQLSPAILPLLRDVPAIYHAAWYETVCPTGTKLLPDGTICRRAPGRVCRGCLSPQAWTALMVQRRLLRRWLPAFDLVVANSDTLLRSLVQHGVGPAVRLYHGVAARPPRPLLAEPPLVAYAGRLSPEKGVHVLLRAFAALAALRPDARLLLVGEGPERERLERLAAAAGITDRVIFTGLLTRAETEAVLDRAWVQVIPSLLEEPFGLALAEALMRGTTVVASASGGPAELVEDGVTGLLVAPGDAQELADAIAGLLGDRRRVELLGTAGRAWALENLDRERFVDRFVELYATVIAGRVA